MESLRNKLLELIAGRIPENDDTLAFCGNEGKYENDGFYEMLDGIMDTIAQHITEALSDEIN